MNTSAAIVDIVSLLANDDDIDNDLPSAEPLYSVSDMLIKSLNRGGVDLPYIAAGAGMSPTEAAMSLRGAIFQRPEVFEHTNTYDITKGWVTREAYLNGNTLEKRRIAEEMNDRFPGRFDANIEALTKAAPTAVRIEDIYIRPGAPWIENEIAEYTAFIRSLLNLQLGDVTVSHAKGLPFKITPTPEAKISKRNTDIYGVKGPVSQYGKEWPKQYLTAIKILEHTLNGESVKATDYVPSRNENGDFAYKPVENKEKTVEAQNKQQQIVQAFCNWVYSSPDRIRRYETYYNNSLAAYACIPYNGDFLTFPDLNPAIKLFHHQRNAVARVLLSGGNVLFNHDVGAGKTYEIIVSLHELYRMGLSTRNMAAVPNHLLQSFVDMHRLLYPQDKILVIYPKDFTPQKRQKALEAIRDETYVAVYIAYGSFDNIVMSKSYHIQKMCKQISDLRTTAYNTVNTDDRRRLEAQATAISKKLEKFMQDAEDSPYLCYDDLGITTLVVDEAHNYKNIPIESMVDNIVGMSRGGSKKCREMLQKVHSTNRVIFATATPITNSLADLYTMQTYLQPQVLDFHDLSGFPAWVNTFGEQETRVECDVAADSENLRTVCRFTSFHNLAELTKLFAQVCDFHRIAAGEEGLPRCRYEDILVPRNEAQAAYIRLLSERADKVRNKEVNRREDNLLKITTDGRLAALDIRLADKDAVILANEITKITVCGDKVIDLYHRFPGMTQIVFCDIGTPKDSFNVYDCLADYLIAHGVPENEIAFVHDATTESARKRLFRDMNSGKLRVVLGSTSKLGLGVNVQERLVALHHLSVPWRPADMVQREGRILRKGNTCEEVYIYRYITEGTFDAYSWQLLENKQRFISSFLSGTAAERSFGDVDDTVLTYAEIKALCIGNRAIRDRMETANKLERSKILYRAKQHQLHELRTVIDTAPQKLDALSRKESLIRQDGAHYAHCRTETSDEERLAFGEELLSAVAMGPSAAERLFGEYQGFAVYLPAEWLPDRAYVTLKGPSGIVYSAPIGKIKTPLGCANAVDRVLEHLPDRADDLSAEQTILRTQVADAKADVERGNEYAAVVECLETALKTIDAELNNPKPKGESS